MHDIVAKMVASTPPIDVALSEMSSIHRSLKEGGPPVNYEELESYISGALEPDQEDEVFRKTMCWKSWFDAEIKLSLAIFREHDAEADVAKFETPHKDASAPKEQKSGNDTVVLGGDTIADVDAMLRTQTANAPLPATPKSDDLSKIRALISGQCVHSAGTYYSAAFIAFVSILMLFMLTLGGISTKPVHNSEDAINSFRLQEGVSSLTKIEQQSSSVVRELEQLRKTVEESNVRSLEAATTTPMDSRAENATDGISVETLRSIADRFAPPTEKVLFDMDTDSPIQVSEKGLTLTVDPHVSFKRVTVRCKANAVKISVKSGDQVLSQHVCEHQMAYDEEGVKKGQMVFLGGLFEHKWSFVPRQLESPIVLIVERISAEENLKATGSDPMVEVVENLRESDAYVSYITVTQKIRGH